MQQLTSAFRQGKTEQSWYLGAARQRCGRSEYCLSNNEGEVSGSNKVTVPHSLEKELNNVLKSSKDTMTPTAIYIYTLSV